MVLPLRAAATTEPRRGADGVDNMGEPKSAVAVVDDDDIAVAADDVVVDDVAVAVAGGPRRAIPRYDHLGYSYYWHGSRYCCCCGCCC